MEITRDGKKVAWERRGRQRERGGRGREGEGSEGERVEGTEMASHQQHSHAMRGDQLIGDKEGRLTEGGIRATEGDGWCAGWRGKGYEVHSSRLAQGPEAGKRKKA